VGVSKLNGAGVVYELDLEEVAEGLKESSVMKAFHSKDVVNGRLQGTNNEVVVDWVPMMLDISQMGALESIEQASGLQMAAIREAWWISQHT